MSLNKHNANSVKNILTFKKTRRGIGELLGSMMVLMIVVALGAILINFSLGTTTTSSNNLISETKTQEDITQERFTVLSVWWNQDESEIWIAIYNYGKIDLHITDIYINNNREQLASPIKCPIGEQVWIDFPDRGRIDPYTEYRLTIVSNRGTTVECKWRS
jgi:hypothetical protein